MPSGDRTVSGDMATTRPDGGAEGMSEWIELMPAGRFSAVDGRGPFINEDPERVVAASMAKMPPAGLVVDYDHATDLAAPEGRPAPAAGWLKEFKVKGGAILARVEWTREAAAALREKKYRYISPVFEHDQDGRVERILRAALVNNPALINLPALAAAEVSLAALTMPLSKVETMAEWTTEYINDLPDSAFAYIEPGGHKDEEGKTVPRSKRHFPLKNKNGELDPAHVRNALARAPQSPFGRRAMAKIREAARKLGIGEEASAETMAEETEAKKMTLSEVIAALEEACPEATPGKLMRAASVLLDDDDGDEPMRMEAEDDGAAEGGEDEEEKELRAPYEENEEQMARRHAEEMRNCMSEEERAETAARHAREKEAMARRRALARKREAAARRPAVAAAEIEKAVASHPMVVRMAAEIDALRSERARAAATERVDAAIREGRLIPSQRSWAIAYCSSDPKGFERFLGAQPRIIQAGADGTFTARIGEPPRGEASLTPRELEICANLGLESKEQLEKFAANKERWTLKFPRPRLMLDDSNSGTSEG